MSGMARNGSCLVGIRRILLGGGAAAALVASTASAQDGLTAVILRGRTTSSQPAAGPTVLTPGLRVESPAGAWTEIAFSDGSSVVLESGAEFTLRGVEREAGSGRILVRSASGRGRLRISVADGVELLIGTPKAEVRVSGAAAVVDAGPQGAATLTSGRSVTVVRTDGDREVIRRPGFTAAFHSGGPKRQGREQMAEAILPFAPVSATRGALQPAMTETAGTGTAKRGRTEETDCRVASGNAPGRRNAPLVVSNCAPGAASSTITVATNATLTPPIVTLPNVPVSPGADRRGGATFDLAAGNLGGASVAGAAIASPGANSNTSVLQGTNDIVAVGQEGNFNLVGITAVQPEGTGRLRRFATQNATGATGQRSDLSLVMPPASALTPGTPASGVAGSYFSNIAATTLGRDQSQTFYDAVARVGIVGLRIYEAVAQQPPFPDGTLVGQTVDLPRFYVSDRTTPSMAYFDSFYAVQKLDKQTGQFVAQQSPGGLQTFSPPELYANAATGRIFVTQTRAATFGAPAEVIVYQYDPSTGIETRIPPAAADEASPGSLGFSPDAFARFRANQVVATTGNLFFAEDKGGRSETRFGLQRGAAVLEVELQQRTPQATPQGTRTVAQPAPARGPIFALAGGNGLALQVGGASLPGITISSSQTAGLDNQDVPLGPETGGGLDLRRSADTDRTNPQARAGNPPLPQVLPDVLIIDKITTSSDAIIRDRGIQPGERYFVIAGTPLTPPPTGSLPGVTPGTVARFAISDGLNQTGGFVPGQTVAQQFLGPGRADQPVAFNRFNAFRPEETFIGNSVPGVARGDTHLLVAAGLGNRNPALRTDIEVASDGHSSASVAVGGIGRLPAGDGSLALSGTLVGSTRLDLARSSTTIAANFGSLGTDATGYGAHVFGGNDATPGQIGYFAVSQADTRLGAPGTPEGVQPGLLSNFGSAAPPTEFGYTRLATNTSTPSLGIPPGPLDNLQGFAAGIVEATSTTGGATVYAVAGASLGDVSIQGRNSSTAGTRRVDREFDATLRLAPRAVGEISADAPAATPPAGRAVRSLTFGRDGASGQPPTTAVASPGSFAAVRPGQAAMASVDADLLVGIVRSDGSRTALPPSNEHLAWGFFLGDLVAAANGSGREYANLGFWVAGRPVDLVTLQGLTGSATYQGGMIGNAVDARGLRTVAGDFSHSFDFGTRRGTLGARFDGAAFSIGTGDVGAAGSYGGTGGGTLGRTLSVQGAFFHNLATGGALSSANLPRATGGVFGIAGSGYGANGIFVGARP
jgi:hypothetical protein